MPFTQKRMPFQNMRMTDMILHELALKASCNFNPDKDNFTDISKDSMQCLMINDKEIKDNKNTENIADLDKIVTASLPKLRQNFIPYPDHNYGQQPPLTPPDRTKLIPSVKTDKKDSLAHVTEGNFEQEGATKCICGFEHDDGYMICCDKCSSWQHIDCMGIKSSKVPEKYSCHNCSPRELDVERAKAIQAKKRENMSEDDDDEDEDPEETASEDETSSNKTSYTAISNTPTRITLLSTNNQPITTIKKGKRGARVPKRKLSEQRTSRRKSRRKEKSESSTHGSHSDLNLIADLQSFNTYLSLNASFERADENKCDEDLKNIHFKLPEVTPMVDFKSVVKCHELGRNKKGLIASTIIPPGSFILEYIGTLMPLKKFEELNPYFQQNCPFVIKYDKIDQFPVVIDARKCGNDARFLRRSCCANAEFKHLTRNGSLHIMIISAAEISKDQEITVPFDFGSSFPGYIDCACGQESCSLMKKNQKSGVVESPKQQAVVNNVDLNNQHPPPPPPSKTEQPAIDQLPESENESSLSEEGKQECRTLSREERKLQAVMKQFEKLEKKQDMTKKTKESRTPNSRSSTEEPVNAVNQKVPLTKKLSAKRKSMNISGKRRTRQSSCSSEPVSPVDQQDVNSTASTPTTPLGGGSTLGASFENSVATRQRKKEKEPLMLTLPIQRKLRNENSISSPTPPGTPLTDMSPRSVGEHTSGMLLTVDTRMNLESTPVKGNHSTGLLQIAQQNFLGPPTPVSMQSTVGHSTSEEKIGNALLRAGNEVPSSPSPNMRIQQRRYYGSLKKHWLNKHSLDNRSNARHQLLNGATEQVCLAALVATLNPKQHKQNVAQSAQVFAKPKSYIPLKKRHILRASQKLESQRKLLNGSIQTSEDLVKELTRKIEQTRQEAQTRTNNVENISSKLVVKEEAIVTSHDNVPEILIDNINTVSQLTRTQCDNASLKHLRNLNINVNKETLLTLSDNAPRQLSTNEMEHNKYAKQVNTNSKGALVQQLIQQQQQQQQQQPSRKQPALQTEDGSLQLLLQHHKPLEQQKENLKHQEIKQDIIQQDQKTLEDIPLVKTNTNVVDSVCPAKRPLIANEEEPNIKKRKLAQPLLQKSEANSNIPNAKSELNPSTDSMATNNSVPATDPLIAKPMIEGPVATNQETTLSVTSNIVTPSQEMFSRTTLRTLSTSSSGSKSLTASPRTSIDSNPESEQGTSNSEQSVVGRKKLSIKDYRNRRSLSQQKTTSSTSDAFPVQNTEHNSTNSTQDFLLHQSPAHKINQATDSLLTPKTLSLRSSINDRTVTNNSSSLLENKLNSTVDNLSDTVSNNSDERPDPRVHHNSIDYNIQQVTTVENKSQDKQQDLRLNSETSVAQKKPEPIKKHSIERISTCSNTSSVFEPVSPINEDDLRSPKDESGYNQTIHTDVTKNPFSIHNDITKNPFGKKQSQGLLQFLSAQKYPHLASITNSSNSAISPNTNYRTQQQQQQQQGQQPAHTSDYHNSVPDTTDNDEDTSSNHSSLSSASFGSDLMHDRPYSYHRSYQTPRDSNGVVNREYTSTRDGSRDQPNRDYYQQHNSYGNSSYYHSPYTPYNPQPPLQQQHQHQQSSGSRQHQQQQQAQQQKRFLPANTTAYTQQANQGGRRSQHHRFMHY